MKKAIALLLIAAVLTGCGVSQADYDKLKKENEELSEQVEMYKREEKSRNNTSIKKVQNSVSKELDLYYRATTFQIGAKKTLILWKELNEVSTINWEEEGDKIGKWLQGAMKEDWFEYDLVYINVSQYGEKSIGTMEIVTDPESTLYGTTRTTEWGD